jgi:excinuclease ABC subunit C
MKDLINTIKNLPTNPGVYIFKGKSKEILYVGKATNLKSRVSSYFKGIQNTKYKIQDTNLRPIEAMIGRVADISVQETDSVLEALILESNLIKKYQPKYNVKEKDDKSFSYFVITKEDFPRVMILRKTELESQNAKRVSQIDLRSKFHAPRIFGPYTSKKQMEIALKIIRKIFPFHSNNQKTEKGCLDYQIGLCPGPYAGVITKADYTKNIRGIRMILEGRKKSLVKRLEIEMRELANKEKFEEAEKIKRQIFALQHIRDVALISQEENIPDTKYEIPNTRIEAFDISNISGQYATGSMVVFNNNEPDKSQYRKFKIKTVEGSNDVGMMAEVLFRRFRHTLTPDPSPSKREEKFWPKPDLIILDGGKGHLNMGEKVLRELNLKISMIAVAKGKTRKKLDLRFKNYDLRIKIDEKLIKRITSEAHRFAIGYHKKLRKREFIN